MCNKRKSAKVNLQKCKNAKKMIEKLHYSSVQRVRRFFIKVAMNRFNDLCINTLLLSFISFVIFIFCFIYFQFFCLKYEKFLVWFFNKYAFFFEFLFLKFFPNKNFSLKISIKKTNLNFLKWKSILLFIKMQLISKKILNLKKVSLKFVFFYFLKF